MACVLEFSGEKDQYIKAFKESTHEITGTGRSEIYREISIG